MLLCMSPYRTVLTTTVQYLYFKPRGSGSTRKRRDDAAGANVLSKVLCYKVKHAELFVLSCFFCVFLVWQAA